MKAMKAVKAMKSARPSCNFRRSDKVEWVEIVRCHPHSVKEPMSGDVLKVKWVGSWKVFVLPDRGSKKHPLEFNASSLTLLQKAADRSDNY